MSDSGKLKLEGTGRSCISLIFCRSWLHSHPNPTSKSMIYKMLRQSDLYLNPDPVYRIVDEINESIVLVEVQKIRALIDSGSSISLT